MPMLNSDAKSKITVYTYFGLFLMIKVYFNSYEDMKESMLTTALVLGLI